MRILAVTVRLSFVLRIAAAVALIVAGERAPSHPLNV
jgi:hypothetical protein